MYILIKYNFIIVRQSNMVYSFTSLMNLVLLLFVRIGVYTLSFLGRSERENHLRLSRNYINFNLFRVNGSYFYQKPSIFESVGILNFFVKKPLSKIDGFG